MGIAERKEREKEQRRNSIVDAAESVFFSKGFDSATMDEIAEKAELSKGTLYLYFKNKVELLFAIHLRGLQILRDMVQAEIETRTDFHSKLESVCQVYVRFSEEYPNYFDSSFYIEKMVSIENFEPSELMNECSHESDSVFGMVVKVIEEGQNNGEVSSAFNPHELAVMLWASTRGIIQLYHLKKKQNLVQNLINNGVRFDSIIQNFITLLGEGLSPRVPDHSLITKN